MDKDTLEEKKGRCLESLRSVFLVSVKDVVWGNRKLQTGVLKMRHVRK